MRTLIAATSVLSTFAFAHSAFAQCRVEEDVDQITMVATTSVICAQGDSQSVIFHCSSDDQLLIGFFPDDYIGGNSSTVVLRGDAQTEAHSFQGTVGNDGQWLRAPVSSFVPIIDAFESSAEVYVRYLDYRRVSHDFTLPAANFTDASAQLACVVSLREAVALREQMATDGEAIRAEFEARGCTMEKQGWVCPD